MNRRSALLRCIVVIPVVGMWVKRKMFAHGGIVKRQLPLTRLDIMNSSGGYTVPRKYWLATENRTQKDMDIMTIDFYGKYKDIT